VLVDTSAWIAHQRWFDPQLHALLTAEAAVTHDVVIGELTLGCGEKASVLASGASRLARAQRVEDETVHSFIVRNDLRCCGLSWPDACLLASAASEGGLRLYTHDRAMAKAAARLGVGWP
jgi:predicted nucleic acid-binding protein